MFYLYSLLIPLFSFILQSWPRLFNRHFGVDVWTRLIEINHVKDAKHKIPGKIKKGFIIEGYFDYPIIFPWIFSFFPKKLLLNIQGFISPFFDSIQNLLLFFIAYSITQNLVISLLAQLIYTLTPLIAVENSNLTPRSLGYLNFTLAFYPLLVFNINHDPLYLLIGLVFTALLFLSHRFALQSFIFIAMFFSIIDLSPAYLASLVTGFVVVTALTKGYYLRVAKGHLSNIYFWILNYKYRFSHQVFGNKEKKLDWVGKIYHLLSLLSPIFLFGIDVWIAAAFIFLFEEFKNPLLFKMSLWVIFLYALASIVLKFKRLIPIGEGQRYLEMATVPSSILASYVFFNFYETFGTPVILILLLLLLGNFMLILFVQIKGIIKDKNRSLTKELIGAFKFINKFPSTPRIICIPHQITTMTVYNTRADVLVNADNPGLMKIMDFYPVLKKSLKELQKEYKLDYLLLRESFATPKDLHLITPKIIYKNGDISIIDIRS